MGDSVELRRRRSLPAGGVVAMLALRDGWRVRTGVWPGRERGPGSILLVTGRGDFIEKYSETLHDLVDAGWGVASFDWRGQGLSGRLGDDAMKGHCAGFETWLEDLDEVVGWFRNLLPSPWFAVAHSMGGHLMQRHLAGENAEFARAVLLSPMLGVRARPLGARGARWLARAMVKAGRGGDYVFGGGPYRRGVAGSVRQRLLTSDAERYGDEGWWVEQVPGLALGSATWGWLDAAERSLAALLAAPAGARGTGEGARATPRLERITTPMLIIIPADDGLVDNDVTRGVRNRMRLARIEEVTGAGHELLREVPAIRAAVLARATAFLVEGA